MAIGLHNLSTRSGAKKTRKRIGRGLAKKGTTAGAGQKGQKSRSGTSGFKRRGMKKLILATPKLRGFKSVQKDREIVHVGQLEKIFPNGGLITPRVLKERGLIKTILNGVKILSDGDLSATLKVQGCAVSKAAAEKILKAGGEIVA